MDEHSDERRHDNRGNQPLFKHRQFLFAQMQLFTEETAVQIDRQRK